MKINKGDTVELEWEDKALGLCRAQLYLNMGKLYIRGLPLTHAAPRITCENQGICTLEIAPHNTNV